MLHKHRVHLNIDLSHNGIVSITNGDKSIIEKAVVALSEGDENVIAAGNEADGFFKTAYPLKGSVVIDFEKTERLFWFLIRKAVGRWLCFKNISAVVIVRLPLTVTEIIALKNALKFAGVNSINFCWSR